MTLNNSVAAPLPAPGATAYSFNTIANGEMINFAEIDRLALPLTSGQTGALGIAYTSTQLIQLTIDGRTVQLPAYALSVASQAGNVTLSGGGHLIVATPFATQLSDTAGFDLIQGGPGNDTITASTGNDIVFGGLGADLITGGAGNEHLYGAAATATANDGADTIRAGAGGDYVQGNAGDDQLFGEDGSDRMFGGSGNDSMFGGNGNDTINGNLGNDRIDGGADNDHLRGGQGDDVLIGGTGDDQLFGDLGNDTLTGGAGIDFMTGGDGADVFVFGAGDAAPTAGGLDTILDYRPGADHIDLAFAVGAGDVLTQAGATAFATIANAQTYAQQLLDGHAGTTDVAAIMVGGDTYLFFNAAGAGAAIDSVVRLMGVVSTSITAGDFV